MAREQEFGTAIGIGVAIPHLRLDLLTSPVLAFGRSLRGIEWNAPDGIAVHHVFLLAAPSGASDLHVQILASIARRMAVPEYRQQIISAPDPPALLRVLTLLAAKKL